MPLRWWRDDRPCYGAAVAYLAHLLSDISRHWVLSLIVFLIAAPIAWVGLIWLRGRKRRRRVIEVAVAGNLKAPTSYLQATQRIGLKPPLWGGGLFIGGIVGLVLFGIFGERITSPLVYTYGEAGEAVVTDEYRTADMWNYRPVIGFNVLIRQAGGGLIRTGFRSDSFNLYPSANEVRYPRAGMRFNVRYLPAHPEDFVIITDDDSQWARGLRCGDLLQEVARAERERSFAPGDPALGHARDTAVAAARAGGCIPAGI